MVNAQNLLSAKSVDAEDIGRVIVVPPHVRQTNRISGLVICHRQTLHEKFSGMM